MSGEGLDGEVRAESMISRGNLANEVLMLGSTEQ